MPRTTVLINDHMNAVITHLESVLDAQPGGKIPVGYGERPKDSKEQFYEPPYLVVSYLVGGDLDGPLSDTQADVSLRLVLISNGSSAREATILRDIAHAEMQKENFTIANRKVRDVRVEIPSDGTYRDDDVATPIFYTRQIYLLDTTPA